MPNVRMPDGVVVAFPDDMPPEQIKGLIASKFPDQVKALATPQPEAPAAPAAPSQVDEQKALRDKYFSSGIYAGEYNPLGGIARSLSAATDAVGSGILMNADDEVSAGLSTGFGFAGDYGKAQQKFDATKQARREQNPVASTVGEITGSLAAGGTLAKGGVTLAGRSLPVVGRTGAAALEGGIYGAANGAADAKQGERLKGGLIGGAIGAPMGAVASKAGDFFASRAAKKTAQMAAPSVDDLANASNALYQQADQAGVVFTPQTVSRVVNNMKLAAGRLNDKLRPKTAGIVEDIDTMLGQPLTLQQFDELRQTVGLAMKNADSQDVRTLQRMKTIIDAAADNATPADVTGNVDGLKYIKEARALWVKKSKSELIAEYMDLADVNSGKYSQSGVANAIRLKSEQLYKRIVAGKEKGFTGEEIALIRQMAKGEMTPKAVSWLSKFAPRGSVSTFGGIGAGSVIGSAFGPVGSAVGAALPSAVGYVAGAAADRAALGGMKALQAAAATGNAPVLRAITNKTVPFIGTIGAQSSLPVRGR